ncbi:transketolase [Cecembia calidifontis]|uniref:Transketolase subunit A n=1 Tax=Cecembia calidifontis TaxID=1187080 RepID=A0A4Q7PBX9_9BACT|nr:transketolase [Cecembia calidifontis]RZS97836.1 transketolase subunit A [Cecembia calidifontis]
MKLEELEDLATQVRRDVLRMVHHCQSGHPGASLGCADFFVALFFSKLKHNPKFSMEGKGEDLFFLSNGHISPVWYSVLARAGYFDLGELSTFRRLNSRLQGHPSTHEGLPGVRVASGSLGQGISVGIGAALGKRLDQDPQRVIVLTGDGELQEGQNWEAAMFAAHHKVDNLLVFVDYNGQQIDGPTKEVMDNGDLSAKFKAFGWEVLEAEGNDMEKVCEGIESAFAALGNGKPVLVLLHTEMGFGVDFMVGTHKWHGIAPNDEQLEKALAQLNSTLQDY